jgi:hypothetical protein
METLAMEDWKASMKAVFGSAEFKAQKKKIEHECKRVEAEAREVEKEMERARKEAERKESEAQKEAEKVEKAAKRKVEQEKKKQQVDEERERKRAERAAEAERKRQEAAQKKASRQRKTNRAKMRQQNEDTPRRTPGSSPTIATPRSSYTSRLEAPTLSSAARICSPHVPIAADTPSHLPRPRPRPRGLLVPSNSANIDDRFIIRRSQRLRDHDS